MRVGWLADIAPLSKIGGAEFEEQTLARLRPADVEIVRIRSGRSAPECDVYVLQNISTYNNADLDRIKGGRIVNRIHDMKHAGSEVVRHWLLNNADLTIFSSLLHVENFPHSVNTPTKVIPCHVEVDKFVSASAEALSHGAPREGNIWIGRIIESKGVSAASRWAVKNNTTIDMYGTGPHADMARSKPNIKYKGFVSHGTVPDLMARYERFVFLPEAWEPFSRTTAEAWASGLKLTVNNKIGALEYITGDSAPLLDAARLFWNAVLEIANA